MAKGGGRTPRDSVGAAAEEEDVAVACPLEGGRVAHPVGWSSTEVESRTPYPPQLLELPQPTNPSTEG